jgi:hypothetical protein
MRHPLPQNITLLSKVKPRRTDRHQVFLQAERHKVGQELEQQTGYKARVIQNHLNCTIAPSRKSFPAQLIGNKTFQPLAFSLYIFMYVSQCISSTFSDRHRMSMTHAMQVRAQPALHLLPTTPTAHAATRNQVKRAGPGQPAHTWKQPEALTRNRPQSTAPSPAVPRFLPPNAHSHDP